MGGRILSGARTLSWKSFKRNMQYNTAYQKIQKEQSGWLFHEAQGGMGVKKVEAIFTPKED